MKEGKGTLNGPLTLSAKPRSNTLSDHVLRGAHAHSVFSESGSDSDEKRRSGSVELLDQSPDHAPPVSSKYVFIYLMYTYCKLSYTIHGRTPYMVVHHTWSYTIHGRTPYMVVHHTCACTQCTFIDAIVTCVSCRSILHMVPLSTFPICLL